MRNKNRDGDYIVYSELCDVCGKDVPIDQVLRTIFPYKEMRVVLRHHWYCNPVDHFKKWFENN